MSSMFGGMLFRLRHLNTGRLVVAQDFFHMGKNIKTVGLCEHYPVTVEVERFESKTDKVSMPINPQQRAEISRMAHNSLFRLVSTGVDIDNRIRCQTSVQIQHVESKGFLILNNAKFYVKSEEEIKRSEEIKQVAEEAKEQVDKKLEAIDVRKQAILSKKKT